MKEEKYFAKILDEFVPYKGGSWCYEDGIILTGCLWLYEATGDPRYRDFILSYLDRAVGPFGELPKYRVEDFNIDNVDAGKVLFLAAKGGERRYQLALNRLFGQLANHPRTRHGNWFHKLRYPNQVWCDGLYMAQPFYLEYAKTYLSDPSAVYADCLAQFASVREHLFDEKLGLYMHAYDDTKSMQWANKETGRSPHCWSRAVGWLALALVDCLAILPLDQGTPLVAQLRELVDKMAAYQDPKSKMWYQVVDQPSLQGNYLETSGSVMIAAALIRAGRLGFLPPEYGDRGEEILAKIEELMFDGEHLENICRVAGLDHLNRDGSSIYYLSEEIARDEAKGVAPLMMAVAEREKRRKS